MIFKNKNRLPVIQMRITVVFQRFEACNKSHGKLTGNNSVTPHCTLTSNIERNRDPVLIIDSNGPEFLF